MGHHPHTIPTARQALANLILLLLAYCTGITLTRYWTANAQIQPGGYIYEFTRCNYDPHSISPITYRYYSVRSFNRTAFNIGKNLWNRTGAPGYLSEVGFWNFDPEINVTDNYFPPDPEGYDTAARASWSCHEEGTRIYYGNEVDIDFNLNYYENADEEVWGFTAAHEIGHAYGLAHTSGCTLMNSRERDCTTNFPTPNDVQGVIMIYYYAHLRELHWG